MPKTTAKSHSRGAPGNRIVYHPRNLRSEKRLGEHLFLCRSVHEAAFGLPKEPN